MKIIKFCRYCGKKYYVENNQRDRTKYCSDACFRKSKNKQAIYKCDYCGSEFSTRKIKIDKKISGESKYLCCSSKCAKDIQKPQWNDIKKLFEQNNYILISEKYINAKTKLEYMCKNHINNGSQFITYNNLKNGYGCKYCGQERTSNSKRLSFDEVSAIFLKNDMILLEQEYKNTQEKLMYICKNHKDIGIQYMSTVNAYKNHCPYCNIIKGEKEILDFLIQFNIKFESHKSYDGLLGVNGGKLSYDFYLPDFNLLIEYQGEQHEHSIDIFGGDDQFAIQKEHDKRKKTYADCHNIQFLEIWYYDFKNIKSILSKLLFNNI